MGHGNMAFSGGKETKQNEELKRNNGMRRFGLVWRWESKLEEEIERGVNNTKDSLKKSYRCLLLYSLQIMCGRKSFKKLSYNGMTIHY